ncbi:MAG: hypothetical protein QM817_21855 [Archangium sp.]
MSRCGRTSQLEAVVRGEVPGPVANDVRAHAKTCAVCRHELNWLESEASLFRQRAGRDEVAHLWAGVANKRGLEEKRPWARVFVAMAAAAVFALVVGIGGPRSPVRSMTQPEVFETDALMSPAIFIDEGEAVPCSKLPSGMGFSCSQPVPASFIASR